MWRLTVSCSNTLRFHCPKNMTRTRWSPAAPRQRPRTMSAQWPVPYTLGEREEMTPHLSEPPFIVESECSCATVTVSWSVLWWTLGVAPCVAAGTTACVSSYLPGPVRHPPASPAAWWSLRSWPALHHWWRGRGWPAGSSLWAQPGCSSWGEEAAALYRL